MNIYFQGSLCAVASHAVEITPILLIALTFCLILVLFQSPELQYRVSKSPKSMMQKSSRQARTKNFEARSYHDMSDMIKVNKYNEFVNELEYVEHNRP